MRKEERKRYDLKVKEQNLDIAIELEDNSTLLSKALNESVEC